MPYAEQGNWIGEDEVVLPSKSKDYILSTHEKVDTLQVNDENYEIYKLNDSTDESIYLIGNFRDNLFDVVGYIMLSKQKDFLIYSNVWKVDGVKVVPLQRGAEIAKSLYIYLTRTMNMSILGDSVQYFGARRLWASISKMKELKVDIIENNYILEEDVILYHGLEDDDFDDRVWSLDTEKLSTKIILTIK
jgi:hypothetical protein